MYHAPHASRSERTDPVQKKEISAPEPAPEEAKPTPPKPLYSKMTKVRTFVPRCASHC